MADTDEMAPFRDVIRHADALVEKLEWIAEHDPNRRLAPQLWACIDRLAVRRG